MTGNGTVSYRFYKAIRVLDTKKYMDTIEVWVEVSDNKFHGRIIDLEDFERSIGAGFIQQPV